VLSDFFKGRGEKAYSTRLHKMMNRPHSSGAVVYTRDRGHPYASPLHFLPNSKAPEKSPFAEMEGLQDFDMEKKGKKKQPRPKTNSALKDAASIRPTPPGSDLFGGFPV
jgi:hypothetical protein